MTHFRILTIDGGGLRGIFTAVLLKRLQERAPNYLANIDLFSGTSTGGILALGLALGLSPQQGIDLYRDTGKRVFKDSFWDDLVDLGQIIGAEYSNNELRKILNAVFGETTTLGDIRTQHGNFVLIPTFDLDAVKDGIRRWKPKFFHNFPGEDSDDQELAVDVALRTSAAPSYFPSYQGYIDGGVVANNPSMAALAQALDSDGGNQPLENIRMISFGTGYFPQYVKGKRHNWGFGQWAKPLVSIMLEGSMGVSDYQCKRILGKNRYHRLGPPLEKPVGLGDVKAIPDLVRYAEAVDIEDTVAWLKSNFV